MTELPYADMFVPSRVRPPSPKWLIGAPSSPGITESVWGHCLAGESQYFDVTWGGRNGRNCSDGGGHAIDGTGQAHLASG